MIDEKNWFVVCIYPIFAAEHDGELCFLIRHLTYFRVGALKDLMEQCMKNNLMMIIDEDIIRFLILRIFEQLKILREAGAAHGDIKPQNIMISFDLENSFSLDSVDVQIIDFGASCQGVSKFILYFRINVMIVEISLRF